MEVPGRPCGLAHTMAKSRIILTVALFILVTMFPLFSCLTLTLANTGRLVAAVPVKEGDTFSLEFRHSVNRTPITENYRIVKERIILESCSFISYGAGIPEAAEDSGSVLKQEGDHILISNMNRDVEGFTQITGTYADHTLIMKGNRAPLASLVGTQKHLRFEIKKVSILALIRRMPFE